MLILSRKEGQRIYIGDDVILTVMGIDKRYGQLKLGFEAPSHIKIIREEIIGKTFPKYLSEEDLRCLQQHNTR
jgi:carbon storage regulator